MVANSAAAADRQLTGKQKRKKWKKFTKVLFGRKIVLVSFIGVLIFIFLAVFAPWLAPHEPNKINLMDSLKKPCGEYLLGTDNSGRDVLSRVLYGTRISLVVGVLAVMIACAIGTFFGMVAGFFGGAVDDIINRISEAIRSIPQIVFAMALCAVLGGGIINLSVVLGISNMAIYIRMMRGQVLSIKETDYIMAGKLQGNGSFSLMFRHVLPNSISPIIVTMTQQVGQTILAEAGLSFLGLGISQPTPSWGSIVSDGRNFLLQNPTFSIAPGICIALLVIFLNTVGDGVRDALDPRLRGEM